MELRTYQQPIVEEATRIMFEKGVCLMACECRTGKSLMSLSVADRLGANRVLFVTTKRTIPSVLGDYNMMKKDNPFIFSINVTNYEDVRSKINAANKAATKLVQERFPLLGAKSKKRERLIEEEESRQLDIIAPYVAKKNFDFIIVDECHKISKFPKPSGCQKILKNLCKGKKVILMSGTPNPESHSMFYHEFDISENSPWSKYKNFYSWAKDGYVNISSKKVNGYDVADYTDGNKEKIMSDIEPYKVTLTQVDAGFETNIVEHILHVPMKEYIEKAIKSLKRDRVCCIDDLEIVANTPADLINKMHQLSAGTIKISDNEYRILDTSKADFLAEKFKGKHIAIFYVYKAEREMLLNAFSNVTEDWQKFQSDRNLVFIGQIRSVREGLKLDTADCSVFFSMEYSYVSYQQGINRIVSKERDTPSHVFFLESQCRIEKLILESVHDKKDFTLAVYMNNMKYLKYENRR